MTPPPPDPQTDLAVAHTNHAKVALPDVERLLPHAELSQAVEAALDKGQMVWLVGPPGAGKSGLAAQVARRHDAAGARCIWYRIDEEDVDVAELFGTLRHHPALAGVHGMPAWSPSLGLSLATFARRFFAALAPCVPLTLIFDDCHRLDDDAPLFEVLDAAREACVAGISLMAVGRRRPPPRLARGVLAGWLEVFDDLRWSFEDALRLGMHAAGRPWRPDEAGLLQSAQGWPAHVIAIGRALRQGREPDAAASAGRAFGEYLANELLLMLPTDCRREFRLLAELPDIPMSLVAQGHVSPAIGRALDDLAASSYFVETTATNRWRLHDLLRDALRSETQRRESDTALASARRRMSGWVVDAQPDVAMQMRVAAGDADGALDLLRTNGPEWLAQGRHRQLAGWMAGLRRVLQTEDLPESRQAELLIWEAEAVLPVDPARAREMFASARRTLMSAQVAEQAYRAWIGEATSFAVEWASIEGQADLVDSLESLQAAVGPPTGVWQCRAPAEALTAIVYARADDPRRVKLAEWTRRAIEESGDCNGRVIAAAQLVTSCVTWSGDVHTARALYDTFDHQVDTDDSLSTHARLAWWASSGAIDWTHRDPARCHDKVARGLALADETGVHEYDFFLLCQGISAALAHEDLPRAQDMLDQLSRTAVGTARIAVLFHQWYRSWLELLHGDARAALAHTQAAVLGAEARGGLFHRLATRSLLGPTLLALGDIEGSRAAQRELFEQSHRAGNMPLLFAALWDAAALAEHVGDTAQFHKQLDRVLHFKEVGGFHSHPRTRTIHLARWMAEAIKHGIRPAVAQQWIRERQLIRPKEHAGEWHMPVQITALGGLKVVVDGSDAQSVRGRPPQKLRELLALLVAARDGASQTELCDWLWPQTDGDRAAASLKTAIQRLRTWLGRDAVLVRSGVVSLNPNLVQCDLWQHIDTATSSAAVPPPTMLAGFDGPPIRALRQLSPHA